VTIRSVAETVREYAASVGCTDFDPGRETFYSPDRKRSVRHVDHRGELVTVWDTAIPIGYVSVSRARRPNEALSPVPQSKETEDGGGLESRPQHKALPVTSGERENQRSRTGQLAITW
jgi:hypothetical protein